MHFKGGVVDRVLELALVNLVLRAHLLGGGIGRCRVEVGLELRLQWPPADGVQKKGTPSA